MIAQVFTSSGRARPPTDVMRQFAVTAMGRLRELPGVEASLSLVDPTTGEGLIINLFRDEAAMAAAQQYSDEQISVAEARSMGREFSAPQVYSEVIALL